MRIVNKTDWSTEDLRAICLAGIRANGMDPKGYKVTIKYRKRNWYRQGLGMLHHKWFCLYLKGPGFYEGGHLAPYTTSDLRILANTINHEIAHNRGIRHKDMSRTYCGELSDWIEGLQLRPKAKKVPATAEQRIEQRVAKAEKMFQLWSKKLRIARKRLQKWARKIKYYAKRQKMAALREREDAKP